MNEIEEEDGWKEGVDEWNRPYWKSSGAYRRITVGSGGIDRRGIGDAPARHRGNVHFIVGDLALNLPGAHQQLSHHYAPLIYRAAPMAHR